MFDVAIVGGGITGAALFYMLSNYSDVKNVILFEKYDSIGTVNSHERNNSQTLHFGDIETNFSYEKAVQLREAAQMVASYVHQHNGLHRKTKKMVIAVGNEEIQKLEHRYRQFKQLFPSLKILSQEEIRHIEPAIVDGRSEQLAALCSDDGYAVNYRKLAQSFLEKSKKPGFVVSLNTPVQSIEKESATYKIKTGNIFSARSVIVAAGAHSLRFAQELGYAYNYVVFAVAGGFYGAKNLLHNKVYTLQDENFPFAAIHGDPDVADSSLTRFGPTAKPIPLLERHVYSTLKNFVKASIRPRAIFGMSSLLIDWALIKFLLKNLSFSIPFVGKYFFAHTARKIVPMLKAKQLTLLRDGGIRPQIFDVEKKQLLMGEVKVHGENVIFNITPSPGASVCLKNALDDMRTLATQLHFHVDEEKIRKEFADNNK